MLLRVTMSKIHASKIGRVRVRSFSVPLPVIATLPLVGFIKARLALILCEAVFCPLFGTAMLPVPLTHVGCVM